MYIIEEYNGKNVTFYFTKISNLGNKKDKICGKFINRIIKLYKSETPVQ